VAQIRNRKELEAWLKDKPGEVASVIALRAALRVLATMALEFRFSKTPPATISSRLCLPVFRVIAAARFVRYAPNRDLAARAAVYAAHAADVAAVAVNADAFAARADVAADAVNAAAFAARTANVAYAAAAAAFAARAANSAAADDAEIWQAIGIDATHFDERAEARTVLESALWTGNPPNWASEAWADLSTRLRAIAPHWQVWIDWYNAILNGTPAWGLPRERAEAIMGEAVLWSDDRWEKVPDVINPRLKALVDAARKPPEPPTEQSWDFFVSYAHQDEADARGIVAILEEAGHSTFAQFKDITPGANFVTEMQRGLADSGRVIALYSPAYVASSHCQSEWNAAYNADSSGAKRKLVPFLIQPTELPPLARQVVFRSLVGLSAAERKDAVLSALAPPPTRSLDQIKKAAATVASQQPALTSDGKLDVKSNPIIDTPRSTRDLASLPAIMRKMIKNILTILPANAPRVVKHGFEFYEEHLRERGTKLDPQYLNKVFSGIETQYYSTGGEYCDDGLKVWITDFFKDHDVVKTHFPLKDEEVFAETPINETEAMGAAITEPAEMVDKAAQAMVEENLADKSVGTLFQSVAEQGRDYAHFPPDQNAGQPGSTRVSVKRRYVVGMLGLFVAFYNFVGSTASIYSTEVGAKFLKALGEAIEMLSRLLLR